MIEHKRRVKKAILPDLRGMNVKTAIKHLNNLGFKRIKLHYVEDYGAENTVLNQSPEKGLIIPLLTEITLFVNKHSLINYLPSVYRQESLTGKNFLKQFLWIVHTIYDSINEKLNEIDKYFNPQTAPEDFLKWIASWLAIKLEPGWSLKEKREIILKTARLIKARGTKHAIREMIKLFLKFDVDIKENEWPVTAFRVGVSSRIGVKSMIIEKKNLNHCFTVKVPKTEKEITEEEIHRLTWILQNEKPAHTEYYIEFKEEEEEEIFTPILKIGLDRIG